MLATLPASGVLLAQVSPFWKVFCDLLPGRTSSVEVRVSPGYPETNLPSTAFFPASVSDLGATVSTPLPVVKIPRPDLEAVVALEASEGCVAPQMLKLIPAYQVVEVVGSVVDVDVDVGCR